MQPILYRHGYSNRELCTRPTFTTYIILSDISLKGGSAYCLYIAQYNP